MSAAGPADRGKALLDRLLKAYGRWAVMPTLIEVGMATKDDERLALVEYRDAYAAALWWIENHAPPTA